MESEVSAKAGLEHLDQCVVGREQSLFATDLETHRSTFRKMIDRSRVLVVGGGGSIGSSTCALLSGLRPSALHVVDLSENYLAELVRDLRGRAENLQVGDFRTFPLDYGSPLMERLLREMPRYDIVLNFAALKHVRSEKDLFSILQMLDVNVVRHIRFKRWLQLHGHGTRYFAVSTDKAANATSLMGASKRLMEDVVFDMAPLDIAVTTSARFANVAFSNGSLLQGWLVRMEKGQPLAVPRDTRRYFVSQREAGEICLLAALGAADRQILFPRMNPQSELRLLTNVAEKVLSHFGYTAEFLDDEVIARHSVASLRAKNKWPVLLTPLDTSGEKPFEEFVAAAETVVESGFASLGAIAHQPGAPDLSEVVAYLEALIVEPTREVDKALLTSVLARVVPGFAHRDTGRHLDQRF